MNYTIVRLYLPDSAPLCQAASVALQEIIGLSKRYSDTIVEHVRLGLHHKLIIPDSGGPHELTRLAVYFELSKQDTPAPIKAITQLKLWEVTYTIRGYVRDYHGLVLTETAEKAEAALEGKVATFGGVAREIKGPFENGQVLTTRTTFK